MTTITANSKLDPNIERIQGASPGRQLTQAIQTDGPKLNLGSGPISTPGWICIDRSPSIWLDHVPLLKRALRRAGLITESQAVNWDPNVLRHDIRALPYSDGSVEAVYSSHALEHIYMDEAQLVLTEAHRVLRVGGVIRIALPDGEAIARDLIHQTDLGLPDAGLIFNQRLLAFPAQRPTLYAKLRNSLGGHVHRWQPTRSLLHHMLQTAGFALITEQTFHQGQLADLKSIETRPASFFLEAVKN